MIQTWRLQGQHCCSLHEFNFEDPVQSLDQVSQRLPTGAYTTFRTYQGHKAIRLDEHCDRLEKTARLTGYSLVFNRGAIRASIREAIHLIGDAEKRIRLTVDLDKRPGDVYISIESLIVPSACDYECGVEVVIRKLARTNPKAKLTNFIATAAEIRAELPEGVNEALMIGEDGRILEGLSSNFFAVQAGELWTADEGVLNGITRKMILEEAEKAGILTHKDGILVSELTKIDEAFLTSSSRAVLPVVRIDGFTIGDGEPGPVTRGLLGRYREKVERDAQII